MRTVRWKKKHQKATNSVVRARLHIHPHLRRCVDFFLLSRFVCSLSVSILSRSFFGRLSIERSYSGRANILRGSKIPTVFHRIFFIRSNYMRVERWNNVGDAVTFGFTDFSLLSLFTERKEQIKSIVSHNFADSIEREFVTSSVAFRRVDKQKCRLSVHR